MLRKIFIIFILSINLFAKYSSLPTVFIGTYNDKNNDTIRNLVVPNTPSGIDTKHWNLTYYTEQLLKEFSGEFENKTDENSFKLILMKDFNTNLKSIVNNSDDLDKKIGFFYVDTYQNIDKNLAGEELITVTINLIFAQIGEEENRADDHNNFEVRYTNGITVSGVLEISANDKNRGLKIQDAYRNFYIRALYDLIKLITQDKKSKKVSSLSSNDIFFSIGKISISKKANDLLIKVYGSKEKAKKQILMLLQEELIKKIRQDTKLDDIVLLYPEKLNDIIVNNWAAYLERMSEVSMDGNTNDNAEVLIRTIMSSCEKHSHTAREIPLDGYLIELYISELYDTTVEKEDIESVHAIKSSIVSRIIIQLAKKNKIDALSIPSKIIKKKKVCVGQASTGYTIENSLSSVRKNKLAKTIRQSIEDLSPKLVKMIGDIINQRKEEFEYDDFCKE